MLVNYFVESDIDLFFAKEGATEKDDVGIEVPLHTCIGVWRKFHSEIVCSFTVFWWQKRIAFKSSICFHYFDYCIILICLAMVQNKGKR